MTPLAITLALLIGASLGLVGGGGSILTVPALVHASGFAPREAIVASLIVVGVAAAAGALVHWRLGTLDIAVAGWFGGFLIVPALALVLGLPMARAVGTSLAVIAINCAAGLTTAAAALDAHRMFVTAVFAVLALTGTVVGARTASRARPDVLRRVFGLFILGVGMYTGAVFFV